MGIWGVVPLVQALMNPKIPTEFIPSFNCCEQELSVVRKEFNLVC